MARRNKNNEGLGPYHVSARTNNADWFNLEMEQVWDIMGRYLFFIHHAFNVKIHSFVLMNNHFHLIISTPENNLSAAMNYFMRETSRVIAQESGRINHIYGGPFFRSHIRNFHYFTHAYKYVYRNPVEAKLSTTVEAYPYSTLHGLFGLKKMIIPMCEDTLLFDSNLKTLEWLNEKPPVERREMIRRALRKESFSFPQEPHSREAHPLETELY